MGLRSRRWLAGLTGLLALMFVGPAAGPAAAAVEPICPADPSQPLIEPEAGTLMNVPAAQQLSKGFKALVGIADGTNPDNPDLIRAKGQHVAFDYRDFTGFGAAAPTDGRNAFLAAGMIAAQSNQTYDLSGFANPAHPLPPRLQRHAPGRRTGGDRGGDERGRREQRLLESEIVDAIQWAVQHDHVNILDESEAHRAAHARRSAGLKSNLVGTPQKHTPPTTTRLAADPAPMAAAFTAGRSRPVPSRPVHPRRYSVA